MAYDVTGKRVLVTGGSSGIGAGLAEAMARDGAVVGICGRRRDRLEAVLERCRAHTPESAMWVVDLAATGAPERLATEVTEAFGGVDVLVNNAGIPKRRHVTRLDAETVDAVMRINYTAPVHLTLALLPQMLERGEGRVVNVSSVAAHLSSPGEAAYSASKSALATFSETLALDLWGTGVRSMVVYPGVVDTELFTLPDNDPLLGAVEALTVDEAVAQIMGALSEDALEVYVPGWFADVVVGKANDLGAFLAGAAAWVRQQQEGSGSG